MEAAALSLHAGAFAAALAAALEAEWDDDERITLLRALTRATPAALAPHAACLAAVVVRHWAPGAAAVIRTAVDLLSRLDAPSLAPLAPSLVAGLALRCHHR